LAAGKAAWYAQTVRKIDAALTAHTCYCGRRLGGVQAVSRFAEFSKE